MIREGNVIYLEVKPVTEKVFDKKRGLVYEYTTDSDGYAYDLISCCDRNGNRYGITEDFEESVLYKINVYIDKKSGKYNYSKLDRFIDRTMDRISNALYNLI